MSEEREQRNQVFSQAQSGVDPRIPTTSAADKVKADFGLDIPVETVPLPSGGKAYPESHPFHNKDRVDIKAMTAREEDILTSRALLKKGTVITELIRSCLIEKSANPIDLLTGDRNALMVAIRITGYGAEYDAEVQCSECDVKSSQMFNLAELPIQSLSIEPVFPGTNLFEFRLPASKKTVRFKFMLGRDEEEIAATQEKQKKAGLQSESTVTTNLLYSIVSIDGVEDRSKIAGFVRMMPARDSLALRNYIRDNEPGIRMKQETVCPSCGHAEEVGMPLGVTFLWPQAGR
jgi:hypothetical protein